MRHALLAASRRRSTPDPGPAPDLGGTLIEGNFQSYSKSPYSAWTGMWGVYMPNTESLQAESTMRVYPDTFPDGTIFTWDVTPDPDWQGVNGYLHVGYGNYDDSPGANSTPRQLSAITTLVADIDWTFSGDEGSGLLSECWLSSAPAPSGPLPDKIFEIAFFPKTSPSAQSWVNGLPSVGAGSFVDSNGLTWNVVVSDIYHIAYRPGFADFTGPLPYDDYFAFLIGAGAVTGDEWFNGLAFGVEPHHGVGSLTISDFTVTYA